MAEVVLISSFTNFSFYSKKGGVTIQKSIRSSTMCTVLPKMYYKTQAMSANLSLFQDLSRIFGQILNITEVQRLGLIKTS